MVTTANWRVSANCRHGDPERLFVSGAKQRQARGVCRGCPVLVQCLSYALDERIEFGVWGGLTERERRALLKARPDIGSWARFLTQLAGPRGVNAPVPAARGAASAGDGRGAAPAGASGSNARTPGAGVGVTGTDDTPGCGARAEPSATGAAAVAA